MNRCDSVFCKSLCLRIGVMLNTGSVRVTVYVSLSRLTDRTRFQSHSGRTDASDLDGPSVPVAGVRSQWPNCAGEFAHRALQFARSLRGGGGGDPAYFAGFSTVVDSVVCWHAFCSISQIPRAVVRGVCPGPSFARQWEAARLPNAGWTANAGRKSAERSPFRRRADHVWFEGLGTNRLKNVILGLRLSGNGPPSTVHLGAGNAFFK